MKKTAYITSLILVVLMLGACSSSSSKEDPKYLSASLIDSAVEGVAFKSSTNDGFTGKDGTFIYSIDDAFVTFRVGGAYFGNFELNNLHRDKKILITELVGVARDNSNDERVVNILRFLQSLDEDSNPSNGISISAKTRESLKDETLDFTDKSLNENDIKKAVEKVGKSLISKELAITHFEKTLNEEFGYKVNSQDPIFESKDLFSIKETDRFVGDIVVKDSTKVELSLSGPDASYFNLQGTGLWLNKISNFATKSLYILHVTATNESLKKTTQIIKVRVEDTGVYDRDGDFIPDDIEVSLGMDPTNGDQNNNGILDGLESSGDFGDQFFDKQWHIRSLGTIVNETNVSTIKGNDLDLLDVYRRYMGYNKGNPIIIQVVDDGVFAAHDDLKDNMDLDRSFNRGEIGDPSPPSSANSHGTEVAGIIAARGLNKIGVRGIAPFAKIAGSNYIEFPDSEGLETIWLYDKNTSNEIAISNNSWGIMLSSETSYEEIMEIGSKELRGKKGRIYVLIAHNYREERADANFQYMINNRYAVTVAALRHDNTFASYSSPGSNLLVSGYSGNFYYDSPTIATTYLPGESKNKGDINTKTTWSEDLKKDYTFAMNGTSAAAPVVSGSLALVLEACPDMTYRDVHYLIAKNAKMVDKDNPTWVKNSAGLYHSRDYGYGLINPSDMIRECTSSSFTLLGSEHNTTVEIEPNTLIPDDSTITKSFSLSVSSDMFIEQVEVYIENNSTFASDYEVNLISPSGTKTQLMFAGNIGSEKYPKWMIYGHRLSSRAFMGEKSMGEWIVQMRDAKLGDVGYTNAIALRIYGH